MKFSFFRSIRTQLLLLVLLSVLPALGIVIYSGVTRLQSDIEVAQNDALIVLQSLAYDHERSVESTRQFLMTLAKLPDVQVMGRSGTGLGLAVVWGTVKDHNGYINVQSEEGKGSTFTIYFPVTREEISEEEIYVSVSEYTGNGESILVVDDVKGQRDLATQMLNKLQYNVTTVPNGEEAVKYVKKNRVDLIVLDMIMDPGIDGLDTYRRILEINPKQKAIIVSGFSETDRVDQAKGLGAGAYLKKPYVLARLGLAVRRELDKSISKSM